MRRVLQTTPVPAIAAVAAAACGLWRRRSDRATRVPLERVPVRIDRILNPQS